MTLEQLKQLMQARIAMLNNAKSTASALGDIQQVQIIDQDIIDTQLTLDQLQMLVP